MDGQTRIERPERARKGPAEPVTTEEAFEERLALFAVSFAKERAMALLDELAEPKRTRARRHAVLVAGLAAPVRQGRVGVAFGDRPDAAYRLRAAVDAVGPGLRREMLLLLPAYHRNLFPEPAPERLDASGPAPAAVSLAQRLIRETVR